VTNIDPQSRDTSQPAGGILMIVLDLMEEVEVGSQQSASFCNDFVRTTFHWLKKYLSTIVTFCIALHLVREFAKEGWINLSYTPSNESDFPN
jgi:hypothetical protein